jgi:hypothetical protein
VSGEGGNIIFGPKHKPLDTYCTCKLATFYYLHYMQSSLIFFLLLCIFGVKKNVEIGQKFDLFKELLSDDEEINLFKILFLVFLISMLRDCFMLRTCQLKKSYRNEMRCNRGFCQYCFKSVTIHKRPVIML